MTPEQRYFFDLTGYLHLKGVLQEAELKAAQDAAQRYIDTPPEEVPAGLEINLDREHFNWYINAFAFDKALEALTLHPKTWPILKELTDDRPRLTSGNLMVDVHGKPFHPLHGGVPGSPALNPEQGRYSTIGGKVQCNDLVFFFYLTDVHPGDGGLIILPCSHKSHFDYPRSFFYPESYTEDGYNDEYFSTEVPEGVLNVTPKAGDVVIISELVTHGALSWVPEDRDRRFLTLRYMQQHESVRGGLDRFLPRGQGSPLAGNLGTGLTRLLYPHQGNRHSRSRHTELNAQSISSSAMARVQLAVTRCILSGRAMKKTRSFVSCSNPKRASTMGMPSSSSRRSASMWALGTVDGP